MRILFFLVAFMAIVFFSAPVWASLPHYNQDIGYTIWLPKGWSEASDSYLERADRSHAPFPVQDMSPVWEAGYFCPAGDHGPKLLVEIKHGRKMHAADISNFNRFIVESLSGTSRSGGTANASKLREARYIKDKRTLRLESEVVVDGQPKLSITYIVYTRIGMLTFVGYVDPADDQGKTTIDKAVLSLYLDDHIRY